MERSRSSAGGDHFVGGGRLLQRRLTPQLDHGIHCGIDGIDACEQRLG
jgi:hypothetical protein